VEKNSSHGSLPVAADSVALPRPSDPLTGALGVCHIASGDRWAGAEVQLAGCLKALARREEIQLLAIFLNDGRLAEEALRAGVEVKVLPENRLGFWQLLLEASAFLRGRGVRILHTHRYKENVLGALLARRCKVPFLVRTQHGRPESFRGLKSWKQGLIRCLDGLVETLATDRVVLVSNDMYRDRSRRANARKIVMIHNGIDLERVQSSLDPIQAKRKLGVAGDCWLLGTACRLEPVKRLDIFLEAAKLIAAHLPEARFAVVGSGSEEGNLHALAGRTGLTERVLFLGHRDDIYDVLRAFDAMILCSDHEGLPMVLLEALHLGVPVVARAVGGISEIVQDGRTGILVRSAKPSDLAEACLRMISDNARRKALAQEGARLVAEAFSAGRAAEQHVKLYSSLASAA
jgi:glycosyltransferase involved in cell wall biosynthesis